MSRAHAKDGCLDELKEYLKHQHNSRGIVEDGIKRQWNWIKILTPQEKGNTESIVISFKSKHNAQKMNLIQTTFREKIN